MSRPIIIDERDGACEICAEWAKKGRKNCSSCGAPFGDYLNMQGNGYNSPRPQHYHIKPVLGIQGREAFYAELCLDCYLEAHLEAYPDSPLPEPLVFNSNKYKNYNKKEVGNEQPTDLPPAE